MEFLFTGHRGEIFEVAAHDLQILTPSRDFYSLDGRLTPNAVEQHHLEAPLTKIHLIVMVTEVDDALPKSMEPSLSLAPPKFKKKRRSVSDMSGNSPAFKPLQMPLTYNDYGELVAVEKTLQPYNSAELTVTETLRLIQRTYHNEFHTRLASLVAHHLRKIAPLQAETSYVAHNITLFLWDFSPKLPNELLLGGLDNVRIYCGPPRVLEIGCGDGAWCLTVKKEHPDWIVEGLDDVDRWSRKNPHLNLRDFMKSDNVGRKNDYFGTVHLDQTNAEFTVRNICHLLNHSSPIPSHIYSLIRAMNIFSKVESYKSFLEAVRCILQPEGVVEFIEIDPRPRVSLIRSWRSANVDHTSGPETGWTENIADRFKDACDEELAATVPEWTRRVDERQKATLRPRDGIPAVDLISWLQGAGFYDVKQHIIRQPVGGSSPEGKLLLETIVYQSSIENQIPLLATSLPQINFDEIGSGNFHINMHVVSGRKPKYPRPGDMLLSGKRQGMTPSHRDLMKILEESKSSQWSRSVSDRKIAHLIEDLNALQGG